MAIHRGVKFFKPKTNYTVNITKNININNQCCHGGGMNGSIFGMNMMTPMSPMMMGNPFMLDPYTPTMSMWAQFGDISKGFINTIASWFKKPEAPAPDGGGGDAADKAIKPEAEKPVAQPEKPADAATIKTPATTVDDTPKIEYKIEDKTQERVDITPRKGCGPWQYALFYVDANGKQVSGAIQRAITDALADGGQKDRIENGKLITSLPQTINVGGQTYTLMDATTRAKTNIGGKLGETNIIFAGKDAGATLSKSVNGGAWDIIGTYNSRAEAEAAQKALEEGN